MEKLLIVANQPIYITKNMLRILPEISSTYFIDR